MIIADSYLQVCRFLSSITKATLPFVWSCGLIGPCHDNTLSSSALEESEQ